MKAYFQFLFSLSLALWSGMAQPGGERPGHSEELLLRSLRESGDDGKNAATVNHQLATIYHARGRWDEAELHYRSAIRLWTKARNEAGRIRSTQNLASLYLDTGQRSKARALGLEGIAQRLEPASVVFAGVAGVIGSTKHAFGKYREAEAHYVEAVNAFERAAPNSPECLQVMNNLGLLLHQTGRTSEALSLYELALDRAAAAGLYSEQVSLLANLGALKFTLEGPEAALLIYQQALDLAPMALGPRHPAMIRLLANCSAILRQLNRSQEAREMDARSRAIRATYAFTVGVRTLSDESRQSPRRR